MPQNFLVIVIFGSFLVYSHGKVPEITCNLDTNSVNGSYPHFPYYNESSYGEFKSVFEESMTNLRFNYPCYACLYAKEGKDIWYKSCASELDSNFFFGAPKYNTLLQSPDYCQGKIQCYLCYTNNCTDKPNITTMTPIPKYKAETFKCWHGKFQQSQTFLVECPAKKCLLLYSMKPTEYWATTCYNETYLEDIFPKADNKTATFYTCDFNECNKLTSYPGFHGTIQMNRTMMPLGKQNWVIPGKISSIKSLNYLGVNSIFSTNYNISGKIMPNATKFQLSILDRGMFYDWTPILKLNFNLKNNHVSYIDVEERKEFRRKWIPPSNGLVTIYLNESVILLNGKLMFKMGTYILKRAMAFSGDWSVIRADSITSKSKMQYNITAEQLNPPTSTPKCISINPKKFKYFTKQLYPEDTLVISLTNTTYKLLDIAFQDDPCNPSNIHSYFRIAWAKPDFINQTDLHKNLTSMLFYDGLLNEIIPGYLKITYWSKINNQWKHGNVIQRYYNGYINEIKIRFMGDHIKLNCFDYMTYEIPIKSWKIPNYLYFDDPWNAIKKFLVTWENY